MTSVPRPAVTVVIPTFNAERTLRSLLQGLLDLPCDGFEIVVADGASTDGTTSILKEFDRDISVWISEPDAGIYDAMHKGIQLGRGRWYYFIGADDLVLDGFCEMLARLEDPGTIYYGNVWKPSARMTYDGEFSDLKLTVRNICHQSMFYPSDVWRRHRFDLRYPILADYALNIACRGDSCFRFEYVDITVAQYCDNSGVSKECRDLEFDSDKLRMIRNHFPFWIFVLSWLWHVALRTARSGLRLIGLFHRVAPMKVVVHRWWRRLTTKR